MKYSENYNFNLPDLDDEADVEKLNENFSMIDEIIKQNESDPELKNKIDGIDAKIGESEDSSTKPTIFGKLAELKQIILEKASEIISAVTGFVDKIGNPEDSSSTNTVFGRLANVQDIVTKVGKYGDSTSASTLFGQIAKVYNRIPTSMPVIRKVQRVVLSGVTNTLGEITISGLTGFSNTNKMVVFTDATISLSSNYDALLPQFTISSISTTSITFKVYYSNGTKITYGTSTVQGQIQVTEFY